VKEVVELDLNDDETKQVREAAEAIRTKCKELDEARSG
jgi:hypothetical protein